MLVALKLRRQSARKKALLKRLATRRPARVGEEAVAPRSRRPFRGRPGQGSGARERGEEGFLCKQPNIDFKIESLFNFAPPADYSVMGIPNSDYVQADKFQRY